MPNSSRLMNKSYQKHQNPNVNDSIFNESDKTRSTLVNRRTNKSNMSSAKLHTGIKNAVDRNTIHGSPQKLQKLVPNLDLSFQKLGT